MERTAQSGTTTRAKMAVNRSRTFHFMLPAVYGACMENVTSKAAGKLFKGDYVSQILEVRKCLTGTLNRLSLLPLILSCEASL